ncbi:MAG: hypothetical protein ACK48Y_22480, partial [Planctomyces sp.]
MCVLRRLLLRGLLLGLVLLSAVVPVSGAVFVRGQVDEFSPLTDEQIESAGQQVLEATEFRSLRRRVLEQAELQARDRQNSFLVRSLDWLGGKVRSGLNRVGDFFEWLWSGLWGKPRPNSPATTPAGAGEGWFS